MVCRGPKRRAHCLETWRRRRWAATSRLCRLLAYDRAPGQSWVMSRAEFIGGLEVSLERNGEEMPPAARTQMEEMLGIFRASDQT
jgi:hypothetical protein